MKSIEVIVFPDGNVNVAAVGFKGNACEKATKAIEEAMGIAGKKTKRPEYYQSETAAQKLST